MMIVCVEWRRRTGAEPSVEVAKEIAVAEPFVGVAEGCAVPEGFTNSPMKVG